MSHKKIDWHHQFKLPRRSFLKASLALVGGGAAIASGRVHSALPASKLARSKQGMVTSPHDLASRAGLEVLAAGGNAIEAAIAMGAVLSVTYPHFSGIGGDAFFVISDSKGNVKTLSGMGQAAQTPLRGSESTLTVGA